MYVITGATGDIGKILSMELLSNSHKRNPANSTPTDIEEFANIFANVFQMQ